jgi:hypothetical protein
MIEGKKKFLSLKFDGLQKNVGKWKKLVFHPRV